MRLVDSHVHLDVTEFDVDREAVVARARDAGIVHQVVPAIDAVGWSVLREVCNAFPDAHAAYGLHPVFLDRHRPEHIGLLREWIARERPVAVGECGLDFFVEGADIAAQQAYFDEQLRLAREFDLPVIVHARRAVDAVIAAIRRIGGLRGVVHSFGGSRQQAEVLWREGFLIGLGGPLTYERARRLRALAAEMPIEYLVLETDAPDQPDAMHRGARNEPARLVHVAEAIAGLRGDSVEAVAEATTRNAVRLFALEPGATTPQAA